MLDVVQAARRASSRRRRGRPTTSPGPPAAPGARERRMIARAATRCRAARRSDRSASPSQAGAAPKSTPVISATPNANASTSGDGRVLMGRNCRVGERHARAGAAPRPSRRRGPRPPPASASRMLSMSAWVTICDRDAPTARRTAVCVRRATDRASSRLATLAQAMSSTRPHTASRSCRLCPYCSFITPTPAPAGTTLIDLLRAGCARCLASSSAG